MKNSTKHTKFTKKQNAQQKRTERANRITVEEAEEVRPGVWVMQCINDRDAERTISLVPEKVFSSSEDMMYRSGDGYVGKYLIALSKENEKARKQLKDGLGERRAQMSRRVNELEDEIDDVREEWAVLDVAASSINAR